MLILVFSLVRPSGVSVLRWSLGITIAVADFALAIVAADWFRNDRISTAQLAGILTLTAALSVTALLLLTHLGT